MNRLDTIYNRIDRYYNSEASVETDLQKSREALESYIKIKNIIRLHFNRKLIDQGANGPLQYINSLSKPPYPQNITTNNMLLIKGEAVFTNSIYKHLNIVFCLGSPVLNTTGMFSRDGLFHLPTLFIYIELPDVDYSYGFGQVTRSKFYAKLKDDDAEIKLTYIHELKHYTDWLEALMKNPLSDPLRGYKSYVETPQNIESRQNKTAHTTYSMVRHINQISEVNARYAEWLTTILYGLDTLPEVKERGILGMFPNFNRFWEYTWAYYAPEILIDNATPKTEKYLKKRLYKFYDYLLDLTKMPMTKKEAAFLTKRYLAKDQTNAV